MVLKPAYREGFVVQLGSPTSCVRLTFHDRQHEGLRGNKKGLACRIILERCLLG